MKNTKTKKQKLTLLERKIAWPIMGAVLAGVILLVFAVAKFGMAVAYPAPDVYTVSPVSGPVEGNTAMLITGIYFDNLESVFIGENQATVISYTPTTINVVTPPHAAGAVDVTVRANVLQGTKNSAYTYVDSTPVVPGARVQKQDIITDMETAGATYTDKQSIHKLDKAIKYITESLNPDYWIDDSHPDCKKGKYIFIKEKDAVNALSEGFSPGKYQIPAEKIQEWISELVGADKNIADVAVSDAVEAGINVDAAGKFTAQGDAFAAADKPNEAIMQYAEAWEKAKVCAS